MSDELPTYPPLLCFADPDELAQHGLRENDAGQVIDDAGRLVCEYSGRSHTRYLIGPLLQIRADGTTRAAWVDRETAHHLGLEMARRGFLDLLRWALSRAARRYL